MKALIIPIKPYWFYLIAKGDKTVEVRKKALYKAIKKLIDEYGQAIIYFYISKNGGYLYPTYDSAGEGSATITFIDGCLYSSKNLHRLDCFNGKVVARFWCDNVEEIFVNEDGYLNTETFNQKELLVHSCLAENEIYDYFGEEAIQYEPVLGCAIHIAYLQIFDKPKELSEFMHFVKTIDWCLVPLEKAPQNFCYVEVDE